jgi:hypothetical protein
VSWQTRLLDRAVAGFGSIRPVSGQPLVASMLRVQRYHSDFAGITGASALPVGSNADEDIVWHEVEAAQSDGLLLSRRRKALIKSGQIGG